MGVQWDPLSDSPRGATGRRSAYLQIYRLNPESRRGFQKCVDPDWSRFGVLTLSGVVRRSARPDPTQVPVHHAAACHRPPHAPLFRRWPLPIFGAWRSMVRGCGLLDSSAASRCAFQPGENVKLLVRRLFGVVPRRKRPGRPDDADAAKSDLFASTATLGGSIPILVGVVRQLRGHASTSETSALHYFCFRRS